MGRPGRLVADVLAAAQHRHRGGDHDHGEADQQYRSRYELGQPTAGVGARHGRRSEHPCDPPPHPAGACVGDSTDSTGHPDHKQRRGDGRLGFQTGYIGQQRNGQNRAPTAEQTQRDADEYRQCDGEGGHDYLPTSWATTDCASQTGPRL